MKALKNESALYIDQITSAIADCYRQNTEPSDAEPMTLYSFIGKNICTQGEKAFVVHLAEQLSEQFPMLKGFSPRNLRRMRDFYHTYDNSPSLMAKAQALSWTQNTVILECCETNEPRSFYISLAAEQSLSKLALMKAIEEMAFESAKDDKTTAQSVATACTTVSDKVANQTVDTAEANKTACGAFVTACEPLHQGDGAPNRSDGVDHEKCKQKRSSQPANDMVVKLLTKNVDILYKTCWRWRLFADRPSGKAPPWWRYYFETIEQRSAFA